MIAEAVGLSRRQVFEGLENLKKQNYLRWETNPNHASRYSLFSEGDAPPLHLLEVAQDRTPNGMKPHSKRHETAPQTAQDRTRILREILSLNSRDNIASQSKEFVFEEEEEEELSEGERHLLQEVGIALDTDFALARRRPCLDDDEREA